MSRRTGILIGVGALAAAGIARLVYCRRQKGACDRKLQQQMDETIEDSFPASDPPSFTPVQAAGARA